MNALTKQILGKYEILMSNDCIIGTGSFGQVFKCRIQNTKEWNLCVKQIPMNHKKFNQREFQIAQSLSQNENTNIVNILDSCQEDSLFYIVMEKCDYDLQKEFKNLQDKQEWYKEEEIMDIIKQLLNGLYILNEHDIIHRDIKQQNILVKIQENKKLYKLTDFGLSKVLQELNDERDQTTKGFLGTRIFSSPQIYKSKYSAKCDIFSLGILFHYLIEDNRHPYQQPGKQLYNVDIDNFLKKLKEEERLQFSFKQYKRYGSFFEQLLQSMIVYEEKDRRGLEEIFEMIIKEQCKQIFQIIQNKNELGNLIMQQASQQGLLSDIDGKLIEFNFLLYQSELLAISFGLFFVILSDIPQYIIDSFHSNDILVIQSLKLLQNDSNFELLKIYTITNYFLIKKRIEQITDEILKIVLKNVDTPQYQQYNLLQQLQQFKDIKDNKNAFYYLKQQLRNNIKMQLKQLISKLIYFEEKYQLNNYLNFNPEEMQKDIKYFFMLQNN